jgi:hypothetical protein
MARELTKIADVVDQATEQLVKQGESDARLHMATQVRFNPLTVAMLAARDDLHRLIEECEAEE